MRGLRIRRDGARKAGEFLYVAGRMGTRSSRASRSKSERSAVTTVAPWRRAVSAIKASLVNRARGGWPKGQLPFAVNVVKFVNGIANHVTRNISFGLITLSGEPWGGS